jgi:hypothetical protein
VRRAELVIAALFAVLGLVTIFVLVPRYVAGSAPAEDLSPAFMPYVAAALGTGAMALLFVTRLLGPAPAEDATPLPARSWVFIGSSAAVLAGAFVLMDLLGYLAGAAALVAGFLLMVRAGIKVVIGAAVLFPLALWLLFDRLLDFPLP